MVGPAPPALKKVKAFELVPFSADRIRELKQHDAAMRRQRSLAKCLFNCKNGLSSSNYVLSLPV